MLFGQRKWFSRTEVFFLILLLGRQKVNEWKLHNTVRRLLSAFEITETKSNFFWITHYILILWCINFVQCYWLYKTSLCISALIYISLSEQIKIQEQQ
jgi:hypothetical protein